MFCCKCQNDIADCTCPDLAERLEKLKACEHLYIGQDYLKRIEQQAKTVKDQKATTE